MSANTKDRAAGEALRIACAKLRDVIIIDTGLRAAHFQEYLAQLDKFFEYSDQMDLYKHMCSIKRAVGLEGGRAERKQFIKDGDCSTGYVAAGQGAGIHS